jgi:hypothetical protein
MAEVAEITGFRRDRDQSARRQDEVHQLLFHDCDLQL